MRFSASETAVRSRWVRSLLPVILITVLLAGCTVLPGRMHAAPAGKGITATPVTVARTSDGDVGYRELGHGPTLLMITGFGATMDDWDPSLVDDLADHFRVIVFDNAGIGRTSALAAPLTVTTMAAQTSALITALTLGPCDVLGWSMGGMIAQSLAATHPDQVRGLVLAATQAGSGMAEPVPAAARAELDRGGVAAAIGLLFPLTDKTAIQQYVLGVASYPDRYTVSASVRAQQQNAVDHWLAGKEASGHDVGMIRVPTLVADGAEDALDPEANSRMLAGLITGAKLVLYPKAGHGFLFQDGAAFAADIRATVS